MNLVATREDMVELLNWRPLEELLSPLAFEHLKVIILTRIAAEGVECPAPEPNLDS